MLTQNGYRCEKCIIGTFAFVNNNKQFVSFKIALVWILNAHWWASIQARFQWFICELSEKDTMIKISCWYRASCPQVFVNYWQKKANEIQQFRWRCNFLDMQVVVAAVLVAAMVSVESVPDCWLTRKSVYAHASVLVITQVWLPELCCTRFVVVAVVACLFFLNYYWNIEALSRFQ